MGAVREKEPADIEERQRAKEMSRTYILRCKEGRMDNKKGTVNKGSVGSKD